MNLKEETKKYLESQGFTCIERQKEFSDFIAYHRCDFEMTGVINKQNDNTQVPFKLYPFVIFKIKCQKTFKVNKKDKKKIDKILDDKQCNAFLIAFKKNKKLLFNQFFLTGKGVPILNDNNTGYIR